MGGALRDELLGRLSSTSTWPAASRSARHAFARAGGRAVPALRAARSLADRARGWKHRRLHAAAGSIEDDLEAATSRCAMPCCSRAALVDPFDGQGDHRRRTIRTSSEASSSRSSPPAACSPPRRRARVPLRRRDGEARPQARRARVAAAGERTRRAGAAVHGRLSAPGRARPARSARRLGAALRPGRPRGLASTGSCAPSGLGSGLPSRGGSIATRGRCSPPRRHPTDRCGRSTASDAGRSRGRSTRSPSSAGPTCGPRSSRHVQRPGAAPAAGRRAPAWAPEIGELLELIAEERAAGTIQTKEEALELVRRRAR